MEAHDESVPTLKDVVTQLMGNSAAIAHAAAGDEILKNVLANHRALEAYEIAAYKSLIVMAMRHDDKSALPLLRRSLGGIPDGRDARLLPGTAGYRTSIYDRLRRSGN